MSIIKRVLLPSSIILLLSASVIFTNFRLINNQNQNISPPKLKNYLKRIKRPKRKWKKTLSSFKNIKRPNYYKLKFPKGWSPSETFKYISANILGRNVNIFRQIAEESRRGSYFYHGEILDSELGKKRVRLGNVSVNYQNGYIIGEIQMSGKYAKIIPLDKNIFAIIEFKNIPNHLCDTFENEINRHNQNHNSSGGNNNYNN